MGRIALRVMFLALAVAVRAAMAGDEPEDRGPVPASMFSVSPLAGFDHNELTISDPHAGEQVLRDTAPEYGLSLNYVNPRLAINDITFYTDPNDSKVWGNILTATVYGDPQSTVTWSAGGAYTWHRIEMGGMTMKINEPLVKAGIVVRIPSLHASLNPYVGYAYEEVDTTYGNNGYDTELAGLIARWDWRMLHATAQYYYQNNPDLHEGYNVARARLLAFASKRWGVLLRGEYVEQHDTKDTSVMIGPVLVF